MVDQGFITLYRFVNLSLLICRELLHIRQREKRSVPPFPNWWTEKHSLYMERKGEKGNGKQTQKKIAPPRYDEAFKAEPFPKK